MNFINDSTKASMESGFLAPKKNGKKFDYKMILKIFGVVLLVAATFCSLYLFFINRSVTAQIADVKANIDEYENNRNLALESDILSLDEKIKIFSGLLNNHTYFANFIGWLRNNISSGVKFNSVKVSIAAGDLKVDISGTAKTYKDVARQLAIFSASDVIKSYTIGSLSFSDTSGVSFSSALIMGLSILK